MVDGKELINAMRAGDPASGAVEINNTKANKNIVIPGLARNPLVNKRYSSRRSRVVARDEEFSYFILWWMERIKYMICVQGIPDQVWDSREG